MIRDWLHEIHVLVKEKGSKCIFSYEGNHCEVEKEHLESADIHQSISLFENVVRELNHKQFLGEV